MFASFLCNNGSVTTVVVKKRPYSELLERGRDLFPKRHKREWIFIQPNKSASETMATFRVRLV